jgi:hypothetical protein
MSQGAYPISRFLQGIIHDSGLRPSEFVQRIGYKNIAKGLRRLNEWLEDGGGEADCLRRIVDAFQPDAGELEKALADTEAIHGLERKQAIAEIEERQRKRFKPFIWVETEHGAHQFWTAVAERQIKVLWMPDGFERQSEAERLTAVQGRIQEHYRQTGGRYPGFGKVLRYQLADTFDTSVVFDVQGNVIDEHGERFLLPEVWMELHR